MPLRNRAKLATEARGASVTLDPVAAGGNGAESVRRFLARLRAYRNVITLAVIVLLTYSQRHWLIAWIDHPIEQIVVQGETRYLAPQSVERVMTNWYGTSFMMTDLEEVKRAAEALPWVHEARVTRLWPGKLQVDVREQIPFVVWNETAYLNPQAEVFRPEEGTVIPGLVRLNGPESATLQERQTMLKVMADVSQQLDQHAFQLTALTRDARGTWRAHLGQGPQVALGEAPFDEKIERLAQVWEYSTEEAKSQIEAIDTRYPNGVAVKWRDRDATE